MVSALILIILKVVKHRVEVLVLEHANFKYSCFGEHEMLSESQKSFSQENIPTLFVPNSMCRKCNILCCKSISHNIETI